MKNKTIIIGIIIILAIAGIWFFNQDESNKQNTASSKQNSSELIPVTEITHAHGLGVDVADPTKLYIATHYGLFVLKNEKDLFAVGTSKDDYMGFSPNPKDPKVLYSSGHPASGGNIGFQKSTDGGFNWEKVSDGVGGPVDFHAMTVSPVNPDLIFGWYRGALQRSTDGGKNWEVVGNTDFVVVGLTADTKDENIVYAASPQGLFISKNKGKDWNRLVQGFVSVVSVNPQDNQKFLAYTEKLGLAKSIDGGANWEKTNANFNGETPLHLSYNNQNREIIYTITEKNSIYKSTDGGNTWGKIR